MAAAAALGDNFKVAILDKNFADKSSSVARQPASEQADEPFDLRVTALNNSSLDFLAQLGIIPERYCPFRRVEVWEEGVSPTKFDARNVQLEQLGWIVENNKICDPLRKKLQASKNISCYGEEVKGFDPQSNEMKTASGKELSADLVIAADGRDSFIRKSLPLEVYHIQHNKMAVVAHVATDYPQSETTWQRFTPDGAQAFLPLFGSNASLVWYNSADYAKHLLGLLKQGDKKSFTRHLQQAYPPKLGAVELVQAGAFPTQSHHVSGYYHNNVLLIGDAAHSIHPLAGQGANLGFADLKCLVELLRSKDDMHSRTYDAYQSRRRSVNLIAVGFMEMLYRIFGNASPEVQLLRQAALKTATLPMLNRLLINEATGDSVLDSLL